MKDEEIEGVAGFYKVCFYKTLSSPLDSKGLHQGARGIDNNFIFLHIQEVT